MRLEANRITIAAGDRVIVDGVDCTAAPGTLTALVGPNGAGKSTLLHALAGIRRPREGTVLLDDTDLFALGRRERARELAFVEQDTTTDTSMTVASVVELGRMPHRSIFGDDSGDDSGGGASIVAESLAAVELTAFSAREYSTLSGGERQRVLLARALAQRPRLLLLDEPTNHLDIGAQLAVLGLLRQLADDGVSVIAALHDLGLAATYADAVIVLQDGRVVAAGPTDETLTPLLLREVYGVEATVLRHPGTGRSVMAFTPLR